MIFENLIYSLSDKGILTLTLNRESKLNSLSIATINELRQGFEIAANDEAVKVVVLTGNGPKAFAAGADIEEFTGLSVEEGKAFALRGQQVFLQIEKMTKPVIAAVNGFALGGGCELAMACHIRIASATAKFGQPEVNLGLIPGYGGTQRLARLIGRGKATELMLTAEMISAEQALALGLVNMVVEKEQLLASAYDCAEKMMGKAPIALAAVLKAVDAYYAQGESYQIEAQEFAHCIGTQDFKEGVQAFLQKRKAQFQGK